MADVATGLIVVLGVTLVVVLMAEVVEGDVTTGVSEMVYTFKRQAFPQVAVDPAHFIEQSESAVLAVAGGAVEEQ